MSNVYTWSPPTGLFRNIPMAGGTRIPGYARITFQYHPSQISMIVVTCSNISHNPINCHKKYISVEIVSNNRFLLDTLTNLSGKEKIGRYETISKATVV